MSALWAASGARIGDSSKSVGPPGPWAHTQLSTTTPLGVVHTSRRRGTSSVPARAERGSMASRNGRAISVPAVPVSRARREIGRTRGMASLPGGGDPLCERLGCDDVDEQLLEVVVVLDERCEQVVGDARVVGG